jgi:hypothetical protein
MPERANNSHRKLTRRSAQTMPESQEVRTFDAGLMWQAMQGASRENRACYWKKAVGEPYGGKRLPTVGSRTVRGGKGWEPGQGMGEAGTPHETGSKRAAQPTSKAPSPDPRCRPIELGSQPLDWSEIELTFGRHNSGVRLLPSIRWQQPSVSLFLSCIRTQAAQPRYE